MGRSVITAVVVVAILADAIAHGTLGGLIFHVVTAILTYVMLLATGQVAVRHATLNRARVLGVQANLIEGALDKYDGIYENPTANNGKNAGKYKAAMAWWNELKPYFPGERELPSRSVLQWRLSAIKEEIEVLQESTHFRQCQQSAPMS